MLNRETIDFAEAIFDITTMACELQRKDKLLEVDSRELCRTITDLAIGFVRAEATFEADVARIVAAVDAAEEPCIGRWDGKLNDVLNDIGRTLADIADDFRSDYMTRIEEFAERELLAKYGKEA